MADGHEETVVYLGGFELPDKNAAAHRVLNNAKILRAQGKRVVFVGVDKELVYDAEVLQTENEVQGFTSYSVAYPHSSKQWLDYLTNIERYIKVIERQSSVKAIILYNFQAVAMNRLIKYCKTQGIKIYADVTEWRSSKGENIVYRILKGSDTWYRMRVLHKRLDGLIVISRYLENYYKKCKNVCYIPALTDLSEEKWNGENNKSNDVLKLVYAGSPGRKDKINILIEALGRCERKYELDIIGMDSAEYLRENPQHKALLSQCKKIVFFGRLSHLGALEYIKKSNYSCFFREDSRVTRAGFPTKFAEAISCGTPILSNVTSNIDEYISDGKNGILINSVDVDLIRETIDKIPLTMAVNRKCFDYRNYINDVHI